MVAHMIRYRCPTCGKQVRVPRRDDLPSRPFCSDRCRLVDLYKWLNEEYQISEPLPRGVEFPAEDEADQ